jgi:predicted RNase H-like nuclease (RuvC/YqgF family)
MNKQSAYEKHIKQLGERNLQLLQENEMLRKENHTLKTANDNLQSALNIMMEIKGLSQDEIKALLKRDEAISSLLEVCSTFKHSVGGVFYD